MSKLKEIGCEKIQLESVEYEYYESETDKKFVKKKIGNQPYLNPNFGYLQLSLMNNSRITVTTPEMLCLFGLQKGSSNYFSMSLQFTNYLEDPVMNQFYDFIQNSEFYHMSKLGINDKNIDRFQSQIKRDKKNKYDPNLSVKVPFSYNKFDVDIYSEDYSGVNMYYIQNFTKMRCDIYIDRIWKFNDTFVCKWKVSTVYLS